MRIQPLEFFSVEDAGRFPDIVQTEFFNQLCTGKNLLIAGSPAKAGKKVDQGIRQVPHFSIGAYRRRSMPFTERGAIAPQNQWEMSELRQFCPQCLKEQNLPWGIGEMVISTDDMRGPQIGVIHNR